MTRWKREFNEWVAREGLRVWCAPKSPADWATAKHVSKLADFVSRQPENEKRIEDAMVAAIFYGVSIPSPMDRFLC